MWWFVMLMVMVVEIGRWWWWWFVMLMVMVVEVGRW